MTLDARSADRVDRLRKEMRERGIGHLWIEPSVGFRYLTGLEPISIERLTGLIVPAEGDLRLVVPAMLAGECAGIGAALATWDDADGPQRAAAAALGGVEVLHVQGSLPTWALFALRAAAPGTEVRLDPGTLDRLRELKDADEIDALSRSGRATDGVVAWVESIGPAGLRENALGKRIQGRYLELGLGPTDVPLVASGANAAMPHYAGEDVPIDPAAPLLIDIGGRVDGYWSDITRVLFPDVVDAEIEEAWAVVCAAYDAAFAKVAVGVPCEDVDRAARSVIDDAGMGELFVHRTGHGIGLEMHESPYIRSGNEQLLEVGHVFSIEPGVYRPGSFGLRYENIVALTPDGPREMNSAPRRHRLQNGSA